MWIGDIRLANRLDKDIKVRLEYAKMKIVRICGQNWRDWRQFEVNPHRWKWTIGRKSVRASRRAPPEWSCRVRVSLASRREERANASGGIAALISEYNRRSTTYGGMCPPRGKSGVTKLLAAARRECACREIHSRSVARTESAGADGRRIAARTSHYLRS